MDTLDQHATALADAIEAALPAWVERCVRRRAGDGAVDPQAVTAAGQEAQREVGGAVRALLAADVDEQATTPLSLLRGAVRYPTALLRQAGIPPVERDRVQAELLPDDIYDLSPATFADVHPSLADPGIAWGAAKAYAHIRRHGGGRSS